MVHFGQVKQHNMQQPHFQTVTVKEVSTDQLSLQLEDGTVITWSRADGYLPEVSVGDQLSLTLTRSENLINDLLHSDHGNE